MVRWKPVVGATNAVIAVVVGATGAVSLSRAHDRSVARAAVQRPVEERCLTTINVGPKSLWPTEADGSYCVTKGRYRGRELTFAEGSALRDRLPAAAYGDTMYVFDTFDELNAWSKPRLHSMAVREFISPDA